MIKQVSFLRRFPALLILPAVLSSYTVPSGPLVEDVFSYTNQFRKAKGKPALIMKEDLNVIARKHSEDMAKGRIAFGHEGFNKRHSQVQRKYQSCTMSENVAYGVSTGKAVVKMWQESGSHRANLLGNYKYIGIGTAKDRRGRIYYTQIFVR